MIPSPVVSRTPRANATPVRLGGPTPAGRRRDRGAVLVHVAVAMTGLLAFSALTIDLGSLWVARGQAQNAADAAALAGGVALAYVNPGDTDAAQAAAQTIALQHSIWGEPVGPASLEMPSPGPCPAGSPAGPGDCLRVVVQHDLPAYFSRLFGMGSTNVQASATAKVLTGNASNCLRPLAIMDSWTPASGTWQWDDRFAPPDTYTPTGHTRASAQGLRVRLSRGTVDVMEEPAGNEYFNLDVARPDSPAGGGDYEQRYRDNIASCNGVPVAIGDSVGYFDAVHSDTILPLEALINSDEAAHWDGTAIRDSDPRFGGVSPRLLTIALVDPYEYSLQARPSPGHVLRYRIRNLIGFFVEQTEGDYSVTGVLLPNSGTFSSTGDTVAPNSSFLQTVALVR